MNAVYVRVMATPAARTVLGVARLLVGLGTWFAPEHSLRLFDLSTPPRGRFVTRLFGARELALAGSLLAVPAASLAPVAAVGVAIDAVDAVAGFAEAARGTLTPRATVLGPVGALVFAALGAVVLRRELPAAA